MKQVQIGTSETLNYVVDAVFLSTYRDCNPWCSIKVKFWVLLDHIVKVPYIKLSEMLIKCEVYMPQFIWTIPVKEFKVLHCIVIKIGNANPVANKLRQICSQSPEHSLIFMSHMVIQFKPQKAFAEQQYFTVRLLIMLGKFGLLQHPRSKDDSLLVHPIILTKVINVLFEFNFS